MINIGRIDPGSGRTTDAAKPSQRFMYKEQTNPYRLYPKIWKGGLYPLWVVFEDMERDVRKGGCIPYGLYSKIWKGM